MLPSNVDVDIEVKIIIIDCTDDSDDDLKIMKIMTMMIKEWCVCSVEFLLMTIVNVMSRMTISMFLY